MILPNLICWLYYPGSGNETARQTAATGKITLMFCAFEGPPNIVRLYGRGRSLALDAPKLLAHRETFAADAHPYVRQAFLVDVEKVQTSCGWAVPRYDFKEDRDILDRWCAQALEPHALVDGLPVAGPLMRKDGRLYSA